MRVQSLRFYKLIPLVDCIVIGAYRRHFPAAAVLFDEPLKLGYTVDHMNALASIETSRLKDPYILTSEVTHGHDKTTGAGRELFYPRSPITLSIRDDISIALILSFLCDQDRDRVGDHLFIRCECFWLELTIFVFFDGAHRLRVWVTAILKLL